MWQGGADVTQERIVEIGRRALATKAVAEEVAIRDRVATLGITEWPSLPLKLAAVNTYDGAVRFFDRTQGVPIAWAIAASTAVPGWYEPITVGDGRYMDGGVRGLNVEGAAGYEILVVIAPGMSRTRRQEIERFGAQQDSRIVQVEPDEESRSVPGDIPASARAGLRLSTRVVNRVRSVWEASSAASP